MVAPDGVRVSGPLPVVVADDSEIFRTLLKSVLEATGEVRVVAEAADGRSAVEAVLRHKPRVLILDLQMPHGDGMWVIEQVMAHRPLPILVMTAMANAENGATAFEAVRRGALELAEKRPMSDEESRRLRARVALLAQVPVIRHRRGPRAAGVPAPEPLHLEELSAPAPQVLALGASAGGPVTLAQVLSQLGNSYPLPILLVQHLSPGFAASFCEFLRAHIRLPVQLVSERTAMRAGTVYVGGDDAHLFARPEGYVDVERGPHTRGHRPSIDVLMNSVADVYGARALGVVLTGMGDDGARGLLRMRQAGAITVAQDEETSVVYGIPKVAAELGAAGHILPLPSIAPFLRARVEEKKGR